MKNILFIGAALLIFAGFQSCEKATANESNLLGSMLSNDKSEKASLVNAYKIGDTVEDFSLKGIDGEMVSMASFDNAEGYVVIFTCNTCPYSKMYEERIIALHDKYSKDNWPVIAINPNDPEAQPGDSFEAMQTYAAEKGFEFPYLFDEGQMVYPKWGAARTPHVFIVKKGDNANTLEYIGAIDDNARKADKVEVNYVDKTIASIRAGEEVTPNFTKAIGCSIKTK